MSTNLNFHFYKILKKFISGVQNNLNNLGAEPTPREIFNIFYESFFQSFLYIVNIPSKLQYKLNYKLK